MAEAKKFRAGPAIAGTGRPAAHRLHFLLVTRSKWLPHAERSRKIGIEVEVVSVRSAGSAQGIQAKGLKSSPSGPTSTQNCSLMRPADFSLMHPEFAAPLSCRLQSRGSETLETGLRGSGHHPASHRPFPKPSNGARQIKERTIRALLIRIS